MITPLERLHIFIRGCLVGYAMIIALFVIVRVLLHLSATHTTGVVIALRARHSGGNVGKYSDPITYFESPVISYFIPDRGKFIENENIGFFSLNYTEGDSVEVFYYPWNKEEANILNFSNYWCSFPSLILLFFACVAWTGINNFRNMRADQKAVDDEQEVNG